MVPADYEAPPVLASNQSENYASNMTSETQLDRLGRIRLPAAVRRKAGIGPRARLTVSAAGSQSVIEAVPDASPGARLRREGQLLIWTGGQSAEAFDESVKARRRRPQ